MKYKLVELRDVIAVINPGPVAYDSETKDKYGKICLAQFYQTGWPEALMVQRPNPLDLWLQLSALPNTLVMQKANYDITTIQRQVGASFIPKEFDDTLLLARLYWPSLESYSLDDLFVHTLGYDPYAKLGIDKAVMQKANWDVPVIPPKQLTYAALDTWHLLELYDKVKPAKESFSYKLDMLALRCALDFRRNGMTVDYDRVDEMFTKNTARIQELAVPINVNSYQQVRKYIGSQHSDGLGLATLTLRGNTKAGAVKETRSLIKLNSFLTKYRTEDGKVYGCFGPYARSGRFTCDDHNLQQLPRKTKGCFSAAPGRRIIYSDYSQLELRSIAAITGDRRMYQVYIDNGDIHNLVVEMIGVTRQIAKTINFNGLYGGGATMMQRILIREANILLEIMAVRRSLAKWKNLFPSIKNWQEKGIRDYNAGRLGSTVCGRKYRGKLMTDQLNTENQGTGAEVAKPAMHYMFADLKANDCNITNFIHDSYILDAPDNDGVFNSVAPKMAQAMQEAWFEVIKQTKTPGLPMPVKVYGGYNWGDIESEKFTCKYEA